MKTSAKKETIPLSKGSSGQARDIEKHLQKYLQENLQLQGKNRQLSTIFDEIPAFVCLLDHNDAIVYTNRLCRKIFKEPGGRRGSEYLHSKNAASLRQPRKRESAQDMRETWELLIDSRSRHFQVLIHAFVDADNSAQTLFMGIDITEQIEAADKLRHTKEELEVQIEERTSELQRKNIALTEVLSLLEIEKQNLAQKVEVNVQRVLLPVIEKLIEKSSTIDGRYLVLLKQNLEQLTSSIGLKLSDMQYNLTPKEFELCTLIKSGFSVKEIAAMHNLSERTVETHRLNIRRKLGLTSVKTNLAAYLSQM
ncbi:MAG: LuxR C-terminal-related transcriptional regulator [Desulfopila sp.]|jgi:DNA-binding CsgD family transcriptional regulator|nr:LuxR C-terminal-related transcriptional regulator [Desulfopila sp.]